MATAARALLLLSRAALSPVPAAAYRRLPLLLRPLAAAATLFPAASGAAHGPKRCYSSQPATSSLRDSSHNWSNRSPKETILLDGCDFKHWIVVMEPPPGDAGNPDITRDEIIDGYIKTLAQVVGSEVEARQKIYSMSTRHYFAFGALVSEELSHKLKELPKVCRVLPDSYLDAIPTAPSSSASSSPPTRHNLRILRGPMSAPYRNLSNEAGGWREGGGSQCWSCGTRGAFLSCGFCGSVQPIDPDVDYFQIFGLKREYNIKDNNLEGKYKDWQKKLHPDLVHTKSEKERGFSAEQSALVIDAYRTLSNPLSRALYLLQLEGVHVDEEKTISDPELLMEMMEIREAVSDASDSQSLENIQAQVKRKLETWYDSFHKAFDKRDFDQAIEATQRMRYYERALEETVKKL